jgi:hypothetical protein
MEAPVNAPVNIGNPHEMTLLWISSSASSASPASAAPNPTD